jgi:hypothetical protein
MKIVFDNFACEAITLPEAEVSLRIIEAMIGEGPDGDTGLVGTGNEVVAKFSNEAARALAIELAIKTGMIEDKDKPVAATVTDMKDAVAKHRVDKSRRRR